MATTRLGDWLRLFLPIAAVICATLFGYGRLERSRDLDALTASEHTTLKLAAERFAQTLSEASNDLRVIADTPAVRGYISEPGPRWRGLLEPLLGSFIRQKWEYEQLRLLDAQGHEVVRVNRSASGPVAVPDADLQDRSDRDYFIETLSLPLGQIRMSRFDLNREHGVIERPLISVVRMSMRLNAGDGHPDYVLVANLRGAVLLKAIRDVLSHSSGEPWLLDAEGYWLLHPEPSMEWGQQLDRSKQIAQRIPQLASALDHIEGADVVDGALYVHRRIEPLAVQVQDGAVHASPRFHLMTRIDADKLPPLLPTALRWALAVLLLLAAVGSTLLASQRRRAARAERDSRQLLERGAVENEERAWIREHVYQLSLKIYASRESAEFGTTVLAELADALGLAAGRMYALRGGQAELVASFGLPDKTDTRSFGPGEGLVGEVMRSRQERRMTPPPLGYLDIAAGMGAGPAADLRILPLWVHGRTVGVMELAFVAILQGRQEELLRQILPLLALNLDGFFTDTRRAA